MALPRWILLFTVAIFATACKTEPLRPETNATRVLLIGNSLTYYNDLPTTLSSIASAAGETYLVKSATAPNTAIIDHLNGASNALDQLTSARWDYVVLQQGPTTTPLCRDSLILWTRLFDPHIRGAGAVPALFMPWPMGAQWERMPLVRKSFGDAARAVDGVFIPAGEAWSIAHETDRGIQLYGADNFHPSQTGSFLAALTIYSRLSGKDPRSLPPNAFVGGRTLPLSSTAVRMLQEAAFQANAEYGSGLRLEPAAGSGDATATGC